MRTWYEHLRDLRRSRHLAPSELATCSGISRDSIRSYESGRRRPSQQRLSRLLGCLGADGQTRNIILTYAGFAPDSARGRYAEPNLSEKEAVALLGRRPWPAFLLNHRADVLAGNAAGRRFLGLPRVNEHPRRESVLNLATRRALATRCLNWDEAVVALIGEFKAGNPGAESLDTSGSAFARLLDAVCAGDPSLAGKFTRLWATTPAWEGGFTRQSYETIWKAGRGGRIRLRCVISCVNADVGLYVHDWHPADAASHRSLEQVLAE